MTDLGSIEKTSKYAKYAKTIFLAYNVEEHEFHE